MSAVEELAEALTNRSMSSTGYHLLPLLRQAYRAPSSKSALSHRLVGELFGLLTTSTTLPLAVRTMIAGLIRELVSEVPNFFPQKFQSYGDESLGQMLGLFRQLGRTAVGGPDNVSFLVDLLHSADVNVALKLEALTTIINRPGAVNSGCIDHFVSEYLLVPAGVVPTARKSNRLLRMVTGRADHSPQPMLDLDGSLVTDEIFTVLLHARTNFFSEDQLIHTGVFSVLYPFLKQRLSLCEAPPNTPVVSVPVTPVGARADGPVNNHSTTTRIQLTDAVIALGTRILTQAQKEVSTSIFVGKKNFKFLNTGLVKWTREFTESTIVETLKCLDLVCRKDPSLVSTIFPHVRRVYERVLLREDSPGTAVTETLKFFLTHSYMVIFDIEPVLKFFFTTHLARRSPVLAAESVIFLNQFSHQLCTDYADLVMQHVHVLLKLAAWYPRTVGAQIIDFISHLPPCVELFHGIIDLPLVAAMHELTFSVNAYVDSGGGNGASPADNSMLEGDQFAMARTAMRIVRSLEFREIQDGQWPKNEKAVQLLTELWRGIPVTPRIAAASKLVPQLLSVVDLGGSSAIINAVLARFGPGKIFLFRAGDIGSVLIDFLKNAMADDSLVVRHRAEIVTAIVDRVGQGESEKFIISLVHRIGRLDTETALAGLPLFIRTLRWLLGVNAPPSDERDIVCVKAGRVVAKPSDRHACLDREERGCSKASPELSCVAVGALTRLAVRFPQYREQTLFMLKKVKKETVVNERIFESIAVLTRLDMSRNLLGITSGA